MKLNEIRIVSDVLCCNFEFVKYTHYCLLFFLVVLDYDLERNVLIDIYNSTNGKHWINKDKWNSSEAYCTWYGVHCHDHKHVSKINLSGNNLTGMLPSSISNLPCLKKLFAPSNKGLGGRLHDFINTNMTALEYLNLSFCGLYGEITPEVMLPSLVELRLCCQRGTTKINGTLPDSIGTLINLKVLSLGENQLEGPLQPSLAKLNKLQRLDLASMKINSELKPTIFTNLTGLKSLNLARTNISGELPSNISNVLKKIEELLLPGNSLSGSLPSQLAVMKNLRILNLAHNRFSHIEKINDELHSIEFVDISHNQFNDTESILKNFTLPNLKTLLMSDNKGFSFPLTEFLNLTSMVSLTVLNISNCSFSGAIPSTLWSFSNLTYVDLSYNKLNGTIPEVETSMFSLLYVDVSYNDLKGCIPASFSRLFSLQTVDISGNKNMTNSSDCEHLSLEILPNITNDYEEYNCTCPVVAQLNGHTHIDLDPSYYNYSYCKCNKGYYGHQSKCKKCLVNGECNDLTSLIQHMVIPIGYWPAPHPSNVTQITKCRDQSEILHDKAMTPCNPTGSCNCTLNADNITTCNSSCICREGSQDRLCSRCDDRWYKFGTICLKCPTNHYTAYVFIALAVGSLLVLLIALLHLKKHPRLSLFVMYGQLLILLLLRYFHVIPGWIFEMNFIILLLYLAGVGKTTKGLLKIAVFYFQILDAMVTNYKLWPKEILLGQRYISSVINFQFPGLACDLPDLYTPIGQFTALLILPVTCITAVWAMYMIVVVVHRYSTRWDYHSIKCHCLKTTIMCLRLTYFPIVLRTFAILASCTDDDHMRVAPWVQCGSVQSKKLHRLAWISTGVYVMGVPLCVFLPLLLRFVRKTKRESLSKADQEVLDKWLGSIYLPYKEKYRSFWEVYALLRQLLIAFIIGYYKEMSPVQTILVSLVLVLALVVHLVLQPYQNTFSGVPVENIIEAMVLIALQHSFILLQFTTCKSAKKIPSDLWIVIGVNGALVVLVSALICLLILRGTVHLVKASIRTRSDEVVSGNINNRLANPLLKEDDIDNE